MNRISKKEILAEEILKEEISKGGDSCSNGEIDKVKKFK